MPPTLALLGEDGSFQSERTVPLTQQFSIVPSFSPAMPPTSRDELQWMSATTWTFSTLPFEAIPENRPW